MDSRKKKVVGAAAGAAAAATAVGMGIAAVKMKGRKPTTLHVRASGDAWIIATDGASSPSSRHDTKRQAVNTARQLAGKRAPSRLVIHRQDGSVQKEHRYEPEA